MIGVVLAAHGDLAPALLRAAESIVGPLGDIRALSLPPGANLDDLRKATQQAIRDADTGNGVLVLCDMFGGTPANLCLEGNLGPEVEVITGVNLPMLLKVALARSSKVPLAQAARELGEYGKRHIVHATEILRDKRSNPASTDSCELDPLPADGPGAAVPVRR